MEITFLLGNGFDIQCGLKTSYIDFYKYILKKKYSIDLKKANVKALVSEIDNIIYGEIYKSRDKIESWADLEWQLGVFTKQLQKQNNDVEGLSKRFMEDFETLLEDLNDYLKSIQIQDDVKIKEDFSDVLYTTMNDFFYGVTLSQVFRVTNVEF